MIWITGKQQTYCKILSHNFGVSFAYTFCERRCEEVGVDDCSFFVCINGWLTAQTKRIKNHTHNPPDDEWYEKAQRRIPHVWYFVQPEISWKWRRKIESKLCQLDALLSYVLLNICCIATVWLWYSCSCCSRCNRCVSDRALFGWERKRLNWWLWLTESNPQY